MTIINTDEDYINHLENKSGRERTIRDILILECVRCRYSTEYGKNPQISHKEMIYQWIDDVLYQIK